ncbi:MAG: GH3 auxin-responsive promoter family protein [Nostocaceae cyanobacterium CSU_2_110]|nr:GH3 auxin-responsive promoter family protein [Nostocaceae cyanobacterium CSU_2_110]
MSLILKLAVKLQGKYLAKQLDITATKPKETQQEFLLKLLNKNQNTVFGREHNFSQIKTEKITVKLFQFEIMSNYVLIAIGLLKVNNRF